MFTMWAAAACTLVFATSPAAGLVPTVRLAAAQPPRIRLAATGSGRCAVLMQEDPPPPPPPPAPPPPPRSPDLFVPILVGASFGGYALIILYDVLTNGFCAPFLQLGRCAPSDVGGW